ncbi:hypothetical protein AAG570_012516 [Ranatra chinensis]|uniref:Reverse transcriptase domain-containing protein n=1 Tax=Ranatra chinensis TaxID=642074 RepID=A0ABD0YE30_9HEMI
MASKTPTDPVMDTAENDGFTVVTRKTKRTKPNNSNTDSESERDEATGKVVRRRIANPTFSVKTSVEHVAESRKKTGQAKIPPITVFPKGNLRVLDINKAFIKECTPDNLRSVKTRDGTKLYVTTLKDYIALQRFLEIKSVPHFIYKLPQERPKKFVIKGIDEETQTDEVLDELRFLGYPIIRVAQLKTIGTKRPLPIFLAEFEAKVNDDVLKKLTSLLAMEVTVVPYKQPPTPLQCFKCQRFGHSAHYCMADPRCVKCGMQHSSKDCNIERPLFRCVLCDHRLRKTVSLGGHHTVWPLHHTHSVLACTSGNRRVHHGGGRLHRPLVHHDSTHGFVIEDDGETDEQTKKVVNRPLTHPASYKGCIAHKERAKKITNKLPHVKPQRPQKESKKVVNELTYAAISKPKKPDPDNTKTIATPNMTDCNNAAIEQKQAQPPAEENVTEVISPSIPPKQEAPKPPRPAKTRGNSDKVPTHQPDRSENLGQTTLNNGSWNDALVQIIRIFNPKFTWEAELRNFLETNNIAVALISETHLKPQQKFHIPNYVTYRTDRDAKAGGGTKKSNNCRRFKCEHNSWGCRKSNKAGVKLHEHYLLNDYVILAPDCPTHLASNGLTDILDIAIIKGTNTNMSLEVVNDLNSDHLPVLLHSESTPKLFTPRKIYDFSKADWELFRTNLDALLPQNLTPQSSAEIDSAVKELTNAIHDATEIAVPCKTEPRYYQKIPEFICKMIRERNRLRRENQRFFSRDKKKTLNFLKRKISTQLTIHNLKAYQNRVTELSGNSLRRETKRITRKGTFVPAIVVNGQKVTCNAKKAEAFSENLEDTFRPNNGPPNNTFFLEVSNTIAATLHKPPQLPIRKTNIHEVRWLIKHLPNRRSPGPDTIQNIILKQLPLKAHRYLTNIINSCLAIEYFPSDWKQVNIIVFAKPGKDPTDLKNYRPISLLNTMGKILEKIILKRLNKFIHDNTLLRPEQCGFRNQHSTSHQLLRVVESITRGFNEHRSTEIGAAFFINIEKAFDRTDGTEIAMYADDTTFLTQSWHPKLVHHKLQNAVSKAEEWFKKWRMNVNASKCVALFFTKRAKHKPPSQLQIDGHKIPWAPSVKYLGVFLDCRLNWDCHIRETIKKARARLVQLYPLINRTSKLSLQAGRDIYLMLLRPVLTYASPVWGHAAASKINRLQVYQNKVLRMIAHAPRATRLTTVHEDMKVPMMKSQIRSLAQRKLPVKKAEAFSENLEDTFRPNNGPPNNTFFLEVSRKKFAKKSIGNSARTLQKPPQFPIRKTIFTSDIPQTDGTEISMHAADTSFLTQPWQPKLVHHELQNAILKAEE